MADPQTIAAQRQHLTRVKGLEGYWASAAGDSLRATATRVRDGGKKTPDVLAGPAEQQDMTLSRPYRPARDQAIVRRLRPLVGAWRTTFSVQDTDADLVPVGQPTTYVGLLIGLDAPERDANSTDAQRVQLLFAVESAK